MLAELFSSLNLIANIKHILGSVEMREIPMPASILFLRSAKSAHKPSHSVKRFVAGPSIHYTHTHAKEFRP